MDKNLPEISFSPEAEKKAIELAAFDILKQLCDQGKITKREFFREYYLVSDAAAVGSEYIEDDNTDKEMVLKYIGEAEELKHERWNRGDMFEKMIVERIAGKAWIKSRAAFWEEGDTKINNREIQIKLDSAEITNEKTLARGMRIKGMAA